MGKTVYFKIEKISKSEYLKLGGDSNTKYLSGTTSVGDNKTILAYTNEDNISIDIDLEELAEGS